MKASDLRQGHQQRRSHLRRELKPTMLLHTAEPASLAERRLALAGAGRLKPKQMRTTTADPTTVEPQQGVGACSRCPPRVAPLGAIRPDGPTRTEHSATINFKLDGVCSGRAAPPDRRQQMVEHDVPTGDRPCVEVASYLRAHRVPGLTDKAAQPALRRRQPIEVPPHQSLAWQKDAFIVWIAGDERSDSPAPMPIATGTTPTLELVMVGSSAFDHGAGEVLRCHVSLGAFTRGARTGRDDPASSARPRCRVRSGSGTATRAHDVHRAVPPRAGRGSPPTAAAPGPG